MSASHEQDKVRRALTSLVRKKGSSEALSMVPRVVARRRVVNDAEQAPTRINELLQIRSTAPDPYEDEETARALALAPLLVGKTAFGLSRLGREWSRRTGNEKLDFLLALPDPEATIQALACEEFVFLVKDIGRSDGAALLTLASPVQLQATLDLDAWRLDRLDRVRIERWLVVCSQAGQMTFDRFVASQQAGVLTHFLAGSLQVFENRDDAEEEMPPDAEIFTSPDGAFLIAADPEDPLLPAIRDVIASVYRIGVKYGRKIVRAVRWELATQLEEDLRQDRERRVADHGFLSRDEAREAYRPVDAGELRERLDAALAESDKPRPAQVRRFFGDIPRTGLALVAFDQDRFLAQALAELQEHERARLEVALTRLAYRLQSARAVSAAEIDELRDWTRHALATCDIGLSHLSDGKLEYAVAALRHLPVVDLFRAGHALVVRLHHLARRVRHALGGDTGLALLDGNGADVVRALIKGLPEMFVARGATMVDDDSALTTRPFESLAEIDRVRLQLRQMRAAAGLVAGLSGMTPVAAAAQLAEELADTVDDLRLSSMVGTAIAWTVLEGEARLQALSAADLQRLLGVAFEGVQGSRTVRKELRSALTRSLLGSPHVAEEDVDALEAMLELVLQRMDDELGGLDPAQPIDPRFVGTAVAVRAQT